MTVLAGPPLMHSLPLWLKLLTAAVLLASITGAFFGPAARRDDRTPGTFAAVSTASLVAYVFGLVALFAHRDLWAAGFIWIAVEGMCVAVWVGRASEDGRDGGDTGRDGGDPESLDETLDI